MSTLTTAFLLTFPALATAYTWRFQATPQQCSNLTISVSGSDGKPPYRVLIIPSGATPLSNSVEARRIIDQPFPGNEPSVSFQLKYPANSQFVAVVSDATGFGSGGTSVAAQVTDSSDSSCFDSQTNVSPLFVFSIVPANQIVQCKDTRIWWDKANVTGTPNFLGVIPGGQSFAIPQSAITDVPSQGTGFTWRPSLRGGTSFLLVGGDERGNGTAGSFPNTVSNGIDNDISCLNSASPSSTPGSPAGGSYPTSSTGGVNGGNGGGSANGGSGTNTGAIIGGVIGGVVFVSALILALFFYRRSSSHRKRQKERPVDLLTADDASDGPHYPPPGGATAEGRTSRNDLPEYYRPEPFLMRDTRSSYDGTGATTSEGRPLSGYTSRSGTPDLLGSVYGTSTSASGSAAGTGTASGRKGPLRAMRPVNVIQHDDAGPREGGEAEGEVETVELPPAYTNIRK